MKILKQLLIIGFSDSKEKPETTLLVHKEAKLVATKVLHNGIYAWYETPHVPTSIININESLQDNREDKFRIFFPDEVIPANYEFVNLLDIIVEGDNPEDQQKIVLYRLYIQIQDPLIKKIKTKPNGKSR